MSKQFSHAATIFTVLDPITSARFYRDKLGFDITFEWGDPVDYVVMNREDAVAIHLSKAAKPLEHGDAAALYVFVHDVNQLYEEFSSKDVPIHAPIGTREYGMRDFDIRDPDGYIICFGTHKDYLPSKA